MRESIGAHEKTPRVSCITPSIRPEGLKYVFNSLCKQTFRDWEWLPRLSVPRNKPDLCYQMNQAIKESKGEIILFWQDYISLEKDALERIVMMYETNPKAGWTFPVGKQIKDEPIRWDWRKVKEVGEEITPDAFEIDLGCVSRETIIGAGMFDERFDAANGFSYENPDLAWRMRYQFGTRFYCDPTVCGVAVDHDALEQHPWRRAADQPNPNRDLLQMKLASYPLLYGNTGDSHLDTARGTEKNP